MATKKYSAFVSSAFESLRDERQAVIDSLLDKQMFPICMEHFTASSSGKFQDLERLIDESDFFILILGGKYGSCDKDGIGWTEREYRYAIQTGKHVLAILCDEYVALRAKSKNELTEDESKQLAFGESISYARAVSKELPIPRIIDQFYSSIDRSSCLGWQRGGEIWTQERLEQWRSKHLAYDLSGTWYHVHLSEEDPKYIRLGTIQISQSFEPDHYRKLTFTADNYGKKAYDSQTHKLTDNIMKHSHWTGEYTMDETGNILGLFVVDRKFSGGQFGDQVIAKKTLRGIHDFVVDVSENKTPDSFYGYFHDEAPSIKSGLIFAFRTAEARVAFLEENFEEALNG
jgi:hypothetical protein